MKEIILEILHYRDLLFMLTLRDIRIRYKQAAMGFLWAIFMPMIAVAAGIIIKKAMSLVSGTSMNLESVLSILVKVLPWTFFISTLRFSVQSLVGNMDLVTKIYFPRAVLPLSSLLACLFDFLVASVVLILFFIIIHTGVSFSMLWVPLILFFLILFTAGIGLLLSASNLFYRDIKYVVEAILTFGIFFTPVFYDASTFGAWRPLLLANPVGSLLEAFNSAIVLHQNPDLFWLVYAGTASVVMFVLGLVIFHKNEPLFAENI